MNKEDGNLKVGGGAPPVGIGGSFEDEERALKKGKGRMLAGMIVAGVAAIAVVVAFVLPKSDEEYRKYGRNINGLRSAHFDAFWVCALEGVPLDRLTNNQELQKQLDVRGVQGKNRWSAHVQEDCLPKLADLQDKLKILMPPEEMNEGNGKLHEAVKALRGAWSDYNGFIGGLGESPYDPVAAEPHVMSITRAWYDYRRTHGELNDALREKLGAN